MNNERWMSLIKVLWRLRLPELNYCYLNYVPEDSEDVREFMMNSITSLKQFLFNTAYLGQIEWAKYFEALKLAIEKTLTNVFIYCTNFSAHEFWDIVSKAKHCNNLYFYKWLIPLDNEWDFNEIKEEWKIEMIYLGSWGNPDHSDWIQNPKRFENFISAVSNCRALAKSLRKLNITDWGISKEYAEEVLNKHKLNKVTIIWL